MRASLLHVQRALVRPRLVTRRGLHSSPVVLGKVVPFNLPDIGEGIAGESAR